MSGNRLLIVESPGKLKTLKQILGSGWTVEASVGHTTELAYDGPKRLGFEFKEGKVLTRYEPRGDRGKQVLTKLKQLAAKAEAVYLATDPDREGEVIAWHLVQQLKLKNYRRVTYTQITESAVKKAIQNPINLNSSLVESGRARQCLDKLVGFEVSPLLWNSTGGKSAGRVQSATLHLICERERERLAFKPEDYWVLKSKYLSTSEVPFEAIYQPNPNDKEDKEESRVSTEAEAKRIEAIARSHPHLVASVENKVEPRNPPPPLITSSLQQVAGAKFRFSPKHTMKVAQELYEGIQGKGLITYMRTNAVVLSPEFISEARQWIHSNAPESLPEKAPVYRAKADAQEAHEAIRPTSVNLTPEKARSMLSADQHKLYSLIWERAIASQCKPARLSKTKITIHVEQTQWISRGTVVVEEGYLRFWKNLEEEKQLPEVKQGERLDFKDVEISANKTQPPPRYSEPRLVQLMERKGIGRPSTYASTIATLKDRTYVSLEKSLLVPTELGMATDDALTKALPELVDSEFTARMENSLDLIAEGKLQWEKYLIEWAQGYLEPAVTKAKSLLAGVRRVATESGTSKPAQANSAEKSEKLQKAYNKAKKNGALPVCPKGHGALLLKLSKKGTFYWKCNFPECEAMAWYQEFSTQKCPVCQAAMEKIPSRKVYGGYFVKCGKKSAHSADQSEVLMFKNKNTKEWEQAKKKNSPAPIPSLDL